MGFHDDKLLIEDTFRLSGLEMSEDLDSLVQNRQKPQYEEMTVSGLSLNEEYEEVMSIIGNKAKGAKKPQKISESMDEAGGPAGMGAQDEPWKIYVNGDYVKKTRHVASFINEYEMDGLDVEENWDSDKNAVYLTVNLPADEDEMEEGCGKKHEMKEPEMDEDREDKTNPKPKYDEKGSKDSYAHMAMEGKGIYGCLNGLIECIEQGTNFCLNLSEDANKTRKQVSAWLESRILPRMEGILDEMEPQEDDEMNEPEMDEKPEGEPGGEPEEKPEGEEHDYDEKEELKYIEELDNVVQALRVSLERIDDEETRVEVEKLSDNVDSIVKDLQKMHGVDMDSDDEEGDEIEEKPEGEESPEKMDEDKVVMDDDFIKSININNWEEIVGDVSSDKGTEFTSDGQVYKVVGTTGDYVDVEPVMNESRDKIVNSDEM